MQITRPDTCFVMGFNKMRLLITVSFRSSLSLSSNFNRSDPQWHHHVFEAYASVEQPAWATRTRPNPDLSVCNPGSEFALLNAILS